MIGADAFAGIRTWHRWRDVAREVCFLVVSRPGVDYDVPREVRMERIDRLELAISSSETRRQLAAGGRPPEVPAPVMDYILARLWVRVVEGTRSLAGLQQLVLVLIRAGCQPRLGKTA